MEEDFKKALEFTLKYEGGYVNNPKDPGGATNYGITQKTYNAARRRMGLRPQSVALIAMNEVEDIYEMDYWRAVEADKWPEPIAIALFDFAVNSGPRRATDYLRDTIQTLRPKTDLNKNPDATKQVLSMYIDLRQSFLQGLRTWRYFGRGWTNRLTALRRYLHV